MLKIYLACYLLFTISTADNSTDLIDFEFIPRVVNGWPGKLGDVPYQVAFKTRIPRSKTYITFCGGTILAPTTVLSAAHCFAASPNICQKMFGLPGSKKSLFGKYAVAGNLRNRDFYYGDNAGNGQWRRLRKVVFPRTYHFPRDDICIVTTRRPFIYNNYVNFIPYSKQFGDYHGQCLASGFGRTGKISTASKLYLARLTLIPVRVCSKIFRKNMRKFICTSTQITDVGKGDSGGPLVCMNTGEPNESPKGILVGVVSGNRPGVCSFFTRVSSFRRYIENNKNTVVICQCKLFYIIILLKAVFSFFNLFYLLKAGICSLF